MAVFPAGHILTSADIDKMFPTGIGAWTPYTPLWTATTAPSIGNGTLVGAYQQIGKGVWYRFSMVAGSTTTFGTGGWAFSLPVTAATTVGQVAMGVAAIVDASAGVRNMRQLYMSSYTTCAPVSEAGAFVTNAAPWTWAVGDNVAGEGFYEAA